VLDQNHLNRQADALSALMRNKLGVRGGNLAAQMTRAGRMLPASVRQAGQLIVRSQRDASHPRLALMMDPGPVDTATHEMTTYLNGIDPKERRKTKAVRWLAGVVFNLIVIAVLFGVVLRWQGLI
jgi:hypothetical protein